MVRKELIDSEMKIDKGWAVDRGKHRENNEDSVAAIELVLTEGDEEKIINFYAVADGVGGTDNGDVASSMTINIVTRQITAYVTETSSTAENDYEEWLRHALNEANYQILRDPRKMATTFATAIIVGDIAYVANIGDSRVYLLTDKRMIQITEDQSIAQALIKAGSLDPSEVENHPYKNVLSQAMGMDEMLKPDFYRVHIEAGNHLLLCTDGLTNELDEQAIYATVMEAETPQAACDILVEQAIREGGRDNISVLVVKLNK